MVVGLSPLPLDDEELSSFGCKPTSKVELVFTLGENGSERKLRMSQDFEVMPEALFTLLRSVRPRGGGSHRKGAGSKEKRKRRRAKLQSGQVKRSTALAGVDTAGLVADGCGSDIDPDSVLGGVVSGRRESERSGSFGYRSVGPSRPGGDSSEQYFASEFNCGLGSTRAVRRPSVLSLPSPRPIRVAGTR